MEMKKKDLLQVGDWVKGKLRDGELIHGYIESNDDVSDKVKIHIVSSDNIKAIGKTIETLSKWVEKLPLSLERENELLSLIDLALVTGDREWFMELTNLLQSLKHVPVSKLNPSPIYNRVEDRCKNLE
jgi:hypothetical protein